MLPPPTVPQITIGRFGLEQRCMYRHPDLYHEEVPELDIETAVSQLDVASGCAVQTFLLLGDQNAGKSTMLHSFCRDGDARFMQLSSLLPVLSSSFVNTRLVPRKCIGEDADLNQRLSTVRDEMPFMDTDIGRGVVLLTLENFIFFCAEFGIQGYHVSEKVQAAGASSTFSSDVRFVALQFVELGGDHLDRLVRLRSASGDLAAVRAAEEQSDVDHVVAGSEDAAAFWGDIHEVLLGSLRLLERTTRTVYFINCTTLFPGGCLDPLALRPMLQKLRFLDATLAGGGGAVDGSGEIIFYCARTPDVDVESFDLVISWTAARTEISEFGQYGCEGMLPSTRPQNVIAQDFDNEGLDLSSLDEVAGDNAQEWRSAEERAAPLRAFVSDMLAYLVFPALQLRLQSCGVYVVRNLVDATVPTSVSNDKCSADDYGTLCAPSIVRNVARLLQRRICSAPAVGGSDSGVMPQVAELILRCAANLRGVEAPSTLGDAVTILGRWVTSLDLATYLEELEAQNSAGLLPDVTALQGWGHAAAALVRTAVCVDLAPPTGAGLPNVLLELVAPGGGDGAGSSSVGCPGTLAGVAAVRLRPVAVAPSDTGAACGGQGLQAGVIYVTAGGRAPAGSLPDGLPPNGRGVSGAVAVGMPLDKELFDMVTSEPAIRAIVENLTALSAEQTGGVHTSSPFPESNFRFQAPETEARLHAAYARLHTCLNELVGGVLLWAAGHGTMKESTLMPGVLSRLLHMVSDICQVRAFLGSHRHDHENWVYGTEPSTPAEPAPKRACCEAGGAALARLATRLREAAAASEPYVGVELVHIAEATADEASKPPMVLRIRLDTPAITALAAAAALSSP